MTSPTTTAAEHKSPERLAVEAGDQANMDTLKRLHAQYGATIAPEGMNLLRFQTLLEFLLGDLDDPRRQKYEHRYNSVLAEQLAGLESQIAQAKLTAGTPAQAGSGLIIARR